MNSIPESKLILNYRIGYLCLIIGAVFLYFDESLLPWLPEWFSLLAGLSFLIMHIQSIRRDFGPLNFGCLFQFLLLLSAITGVIYFIYY